MGKILIAANLDFRYHSTNPLDLAEMLAVDGHEVVVAASFDQMALKSNAKRGFVCKALPLSGMISLGRFCFHALMEAHRFKPDIAIGVNTAGAVFADLAKSFGFARKCGWYNLELILPEYHKRVLSVRWASWRARSLDFVIATGPVRAEVMRDAFHLKSLPFVVANAPVHGPENPELFLRTRVDELGCGTAGIIVYSGGYRDELLNAIEASKLWKSDTALVMLVICHDENSRMSLEIAVRGAPNRAFLLPPVFKGRDVLLDWLSSADAGLVLYDHRLWPDKNYLYCTPNKLYDYMACSLPVVGSDNPSLQRDLQSLGWGLCCDPGDPQSIADTVDQVMMRNDEFSRRAGFLFESLFNYRIQSDAVRRLIAELIQT